MSSEGRLEPVRPGHCDGCGGPLPDPPDPRVSRLKAHRLCSRRCQNRELERRRNARSDWGREDTCTAKRGHASKEDAEAIIAQYGRQSTHRPYHCRHCGRWHVGRYDAST